MSQLQKQDLYFSYLVERDKDPLFCLLCPVSVEFSTTGSWFAGRVSKLCFQSNAGNASSRELLTALTVVFNAKQGCSVGDNAY